jgi:hypothetical protein
MYTFGTSLQDRITTVTKICDESEPLSALEPRMGLFYKIQSQFRLFLVRKTLGFNLGLRWPPETGGERQTEHTVANSGKTNYQTDDNKTDTIASLFEKFRGRAIILPTCSADRLTAMLIQCVVNDHKDLAPLEVQCLNQNPEKAMRHKINAPSTFPPKSVNASKAPRMVESHGQNHLAHRVLSHRQRPSNQQGHKNAVTRSAEASPESDLVNSERICYFLFHPGVPPSPCLFPKNGFARNAFFSTIFPINQQGLDSKMAKL